MTSNFLIGFTLIAICGFHHFLFQKQLSYRVEAVKQNGVVLNLFAVSWLSIALIAVSAYFLRVVVLPREHFLGYIIPVGILIFAAYLGYRRHYYILKEAKIITDRERRRRMAGRAFGAKSTGAGSFGGLKYSLISYLVMCLFLSLMILIEEAPYFSKDYGFLDMVDEKWPFVVGISAAVWFFSFFGQDEDE
ncbi:MAG: hypothetical protein AAF202_00950 [Pseudomonadota bacterium]